MLILLETMHILLRNVPAASSAGANKIQTKAKNELIIPL